MREFLLEKLATEAVRQSLEGFKLSWGFPDPIYIDCRAALGDPATLYAAAACVFNELDTEKVERIAGIAYGGLSLSTATSLLSLAKGNPTGALGIRKRPKKHGIGLSIEGGYMAWDNICIIDDVCTTGQSLLTAIDTAKDAGLQVVQVIVLVDRQLGGLYEIERLLPDAKVSAIFTKDELVNYRIQ